MLREAGIDSIQLMIGFDFSSSNKISGQETYGRCLHDLSFNNPYMHIVDILQPIICEFDNDGIIQAFRFGCEDTKDKSVLPLQYPEKTDPNFQGFGALLDGYRRALQFVKMDGPTNLAPLIRKAIEIERKMGCQ